MLIISDSIHAPFSQTQSLYDVKPPQICDDLHPKFLTVFPINTYSPVLFIQSQFLVPTSKPLLFWSLLLVMVPGPEAGRPLSPPTTAPSSISIVPTLMQMFAIPCMTTAVAPLLLISTPSYSPTHF